MKTLPQLLDQHNITAHADRLEFEEIVNEVTRQHGEELQSVQIACDKSVSDAKFEAATAIDAAREEVSALTAQLLALREKTSLAVKTASEAINNTDLDDQATLAVLSAVISDVTKDDRERAREALAADIAAKQAELAALA